MTKTVKRAITHERVKELLHYDPETGIFQWRTARPGANTESKVGTVKKGGYLLIVIDRQRILAHRLAIFYVTGEWPENPVDHIDGNPPNNKYTNLREVPQVLNLQNMRKVRASSKSGTMGISWCARDQTWRARISVNGVRKTFYNKDRAKLEQTYIEQKRKLHPGCTL